MAANYSAEVILMVLECWSSSEEFYFKSISSHLSVMLVKSLPSAISVV